LNSIASLPEALPDGADGGKIYFYGGWSKPCHRPKMRDNRSPVRVTDSFLGVLLSECNP